MRKHRYYCMFACETLQRLAVLVVCHGFTLGQITSHHILIQRPMSWSKAQEFCKRHYMDLAVLNTEEQYFALLNATLASKNSYWLGLQRESISSSWTWVNGEELSYEHWFRRNFVGRCASLEAMLETKKKLLARYCDELHMTVCQGPVSPNPNLDSVGTDQLSLSWNVSAFMQMTPHTYNVTICTSTCDTLIYHYINGSTIMSIGISNLTSATEYFIMITAFVVRPDTVTGGKTILQSNPAALQVRTEHSYKEYKLIIVILKLLKVVYLAPAVWILYHILRKRDIQDESHHEVVSVEISTEQMIPDLVPEKIRGIG